MVNIFIENLLKLKYDNRESWFKVGEAAGVTAQAAHKWSKGGNISEEQLNKLAAHYGMSPSQLKYGQDSLGDAERALLANFRAAGSVEQKNILQVAKKAARIGQPLKPKTLPQQRKKTV